MRIAILWLVLATRAWAWPWSNARYFGCKNQFEFVAIQLELWACEHKGLYPTSLGQLEKVPVCPEAGYDTYSDSYRTTPDRRSYVFYCAGDHHLASGMPRNLPAFSSDVGLGSEHSHMSERRCRARMQALGALDPDVVVDADTLRCGYGHMEEGYAPFSPRYERGQWIEERLPPVMPSWWQVFFPCFLILSGLLPACSWFTLRQRR